MSAIDLRIAETVAGAAGGGDGDGSPLAIDLPAAADDAAARVVAYTGLEPAQAIPPAEAISRKEWRAANFASIDVLLAPLLDEAGRGLGPLQGPALVAGRAVLGAEVGTVMGVLGRRVLGQVDVRLTDPGAPLRLLMVVPNLHAAAANLGVDEEQLVRWVTVHEMTHVVQFTGVPWLREHLAGLVERLLAGGESSLPSVDDLRAAIRGEGGLRRAALGPARADAFEQLQAVMSVVEGHAEHVMDAAGAAVLPDLPQLRAALAARREQSSSLLSPWKLVERLLGMELKMRQYAEGKAFCDAVVEASDVASLHRVFAAPELLPTLAELREPSAWLARAV